MKNVPAVTPWLAKVSVFANTNLFANDKNLFIADD